MTLKHGFLLFSRPAKREPGDDAALARQIFGKL